MSQMLAFELVENATPNVFLVKLTDARQMAALTREEGYEKPFSIPPIPILFDEGNGELILAEGFDDKSPSGRIAMRVLDKIYCEALDRIAARDAGRQSELNAPKALSISF